MCKWCTAHKGGCRPCAIESCNKNLVSEVREGREGRGGEGRGGDGRGGEGREIVPKSRKITQNNQRKEDCR